MHKTKTLYVAAIVAFACLAATAQQPANKTFASNGNMGFVHDCSQNGCNVISVHTDTQVGPGGATTGFLFYAIAAPDGTVFFGVGNVKIDAFSGDGRNTLSFNFNTGVPGFDNFVFYRDGSFALGPGGNINVTWTKTPVFAGSTAGTQASTTPHSRFQKTGNTTFSSAHLTGTAFGVAFDSFAAQMGTEQNTTIFVQINQ